MKKNKKIKHRGQVFTPDYLVEIILNQGHYVEGKINRKHIIDNSCGDGQFLIHIIDRYCKDYLKNNSNLEQLKHELETYIHAIEINNKELSIAKRRCDTVANYYGIYNTNWNFINGDALKINVFNGIMDFVVGNPPYVRIHNLKNNFNSVKSRSFTRNGMTDLYIVFYEIGIKMLNNTGILTYITPSSFFTSVAGYKMRRYLTDHYLLESVCDLKHFQPFNSTTYTAIICINKNVKNKNINYFEFDKQKLLPLPIEKLKINDYVINNQFYFATKEKLNILKEIIENRKKTDIIVKNGFATLADKIFINNFNFKSKYIIPILKASQAKWYSIFYPYDTNSQLVKEDNLKKDSRIYEYIINNKSKLIKRSKEKNNDNYWYAFGRSQGIHDTYSHKIAINTLIRKSSDLKITDVPAGCGIYSGLYICSNTINFTKIKQALLDEQFSLYISLLEKYKNGGYYTFSSKDVKRYLDYKLGKE